MRLPKDALISDEKLTKYLLAPRRRHDKSKWLAQAGYSPENWPILKEDIKNQILPSEASLVETTEYGTMCEIKAELKGPNGKVLPVYTIWMIESTADVPKFITMYPDRG